MKNLVSLIVVFIFLSACSESNDNTRKELVEWASQVADIEIRADITMKKADPTFNALANRLPTSEDMKI